MKPPTKPVKEYIIVNLRGGTRLRMEAGRGEGKPFDKLLSILDCLQSWDADAGAGGEWSDGTLRAARVAEEESAPIAAISDCAAKTFRTNDYHPA